LSALIEAHSDHAVVISLTDEGRRFYESIAAHVLAIEEAMNEAVGSNAQVRGRLRVNVDHGTAQFLVIPRLAPFLAAHPELLVEISARDRLGDFIRDGFDVAILEEQGLERPASSKGDTTAPDWHAAHPEIVIRRSFRPLRVLICGGGCAGPALAFWLARGGHRVFLRCSAPHVCVVGSTFLDNAGTVIGSRTAPSCAPNSARAISAARTSYGAIAAKATWRWSCA
jgi:DNA-binding transcriptional LysR family regulator